MASRTSLSYLRGQRSSISIRARGEPGDRQRARELEIMKLRSCHHASRDHRGRVWYRVPGTGAKVAVAAFSAGQLSTLAVVRDVYMYYTQPWASQDLARLIRHEAVRYRHAALGRCGESWRSNTLTLTSSLS